MSNNQQNPQRGAQQSQTPRQDYKSDKPSSQQPQKNDANKTGTASSPYDKSSRS